MRPKDGQKEKRDAEVNLDTADVCLLTGFCLLDSTCCAAQSNDGNDDAERNLKIIRGTREIGLEITKSGSSAGKKMA